MDYKQLASDLISGCEENCADCGYAGDSEFECTIAQLAATAITDLLARAEVAEKEVERLHESLDFARTKDAEIVRLGQLLNEAEAREKNLIEAMQVVMARAEKMESERDAAVKCIEEIEDALNFKRMSAIRLRISEWPGR